MDLKSLFLQQSLCKALPIPVFLLQTDKAANVHNIQKRRVKLMWINHFKTTQ
jgi:hypothetical protein